MFNAKDLKIEEVNSKLNDITGMLSEEIHDRDSYSEVKDMLEGVALSFNDVAEHLKLYAEAIPNYLYPDIGPGENSGLDKDDWDALKKQEGKVRQINSKLNGVVKDLMDLNKEVEPIFRKIFG